MIIKAAAPVERLNNPPQLMASRVTTSNNYLVWVEASALPPTDLVGVNKKDVKQLRKSKRLVGDIWDGIF